MPSPRIHALLRRIDTLERNQQRILSGQYTQVSSVTRNDTNTIDCLIMGDIPLSYSVVLVIDTGSATGQIAQVVPYTADNVTSYESNSIGVALGAGTTGNTVKVQIAGSCLVRILPGTASFAFNDTTTGAIRAGTHLKINDSGQVEVDLGQENVKFVALESQYYNVSSPSDPTKNDDVILCSFFAGGGGGGGDTLLSVFGKVDDATQEYTCYVYGNGYSEAPTGSLDLVRFPRVAVNIGVTIIAGMKVAGAKHGAETYYTSLTPDVWQDGNDPF
jgi:hypothetical protein